MNHLLSIQDLPLKTVQDFFKQAEFYRDHEAAASLSGKTVGLLFFENSTRTRSSFETATRKLGGSPLSLNIATSSVQKGESPVDTAKNIVALGASAIVMRHSASGSVGDAARAAGVPVINGGDGTREHPSQALLDAFTLQSHWGSLQDKRVLIVGDIAHSRVAHSNLALLPRLGAKVTVCGPPTLLPQKAFLGPVESTSDLDAVLPRADAIMTLRLQMERFEGTGHIPSAAEYRQFWGLTRDRLKLLPQQSLILDPGPTQLGVALDPEAAQDPRALILQQVHSGVWIRMAILNWALGVKGMKSS